MFSEPSGWLYRGLLCLLRLQMSANRGLGLPYLRKPCRGASELRQKVRKRQPADGAVDIRATGADGLAVPCRPYGCFRRCAMYKNFGENFSFMFATFFVLKRRTLFCRAQGELACSLGRLPARAAYVQCPESLLLVATRKTVALEPVFRCSIVPRIWVDPTFVGEFR